MLPSIVDLLDAEVDWEFDGHSLFDGSSPTIEPRVSTDVAAVLDIASTSGRGLPPRRRLDRPRRRRRVRRPRRVATSPTLEIGTASEYTATIDQAAEFVDLPTDDGEMPFSISGTVAGPSPPPELLVAVNGRIAGVIGGYVA